MAVDIIIHINTFSSKEAEVTKLEILDSIEGELGYPDNAIQIFEDPINANDGFDVFLKYLQVTSVPYDLFQSLGKSYGLYFLVFDLQTNVRRGYWYDEDDLWVEKLMDSSFIKSLDEIFEHNEI